ncbi:MAG: hypothetical protein KVP17_004418 [Porospora cf. gigantea B]|uniref:uncharacterized protein n=1 Tax=Porospora cf. gigantea B TaxID=2853592 RepID=UPI003571DF7A|nr:MAG: hypothetical protein KVP17_004418 [Porospora cf. gigantea B]
MPKVTPPVRSTSRSLPNYGKPTVASRARQGITPVYKSAARTTSRAKKRPSYLRRAENPLKLGDTSKVSVISHGRKIKTPREDPRSTPGLSTSLIPETAGSTPVSWSTEFPDISRHRPQCDEEIVPLLPLLEPGRFYQLTSRRSAAGLVCPRCRFCLDMAPLQLYVGRRASDVQRPLTRSPYMPSNLPVTPTESLYDPQTLRESMASIERDIRRFEEAREDEEFLTPAYVFEEADFSYVSPGKGPLFSSRLKPLHVPPAKLMPSASPLEPSSPMKPTKSPSPLEPSRSASPMKPTKSPSPVEPSKSASPMDPSKSASYRESTKSVSPMEPAKSASPREPTKSVSPMEPTKSVSPIEPTESAKSASPVKPSKRATLAEEDSTLKKHLTKPKLRRGSISFNSISAWDTLGLTPLRTSEKHRPRPVVQKDEMKQPSPASSHRPSLLLPASVSRPSSLESSSPFGDSNTPLPVR